MSTIRRERPFRGRIWLAFDPVGIAWMTEDEAEMRTVEARGWRVREYKLAPEKGEEPAMPAEEEPLL
jgi:hypothetical protein